MADTFSAFREMHKARVAKNPQRLQYASDQLRQNGIDFKVCNETTSQINCYFESGKIHTFYAGTGKIKGYDNLRGIKAFVKLCLKEKQKQCTH